MQTTITGSNYSKNGTGNANDGACVQECGCGQCDALRMHSGLCSRADPAWCTCQTTDASSPESGGARYGETCKNTAKDGMFTA